MKGAMYRIRLTGLKTPQGTVPLAALAALSQALLEGCERSLRLAVEGASVKRGRVPAWLSRSLDFTFSGIGEGSTTLDVEAPTLAEAAPEQVQQQDFWYTLPNPEDTALTLLSRSVADATSEQVDSDRFDRGVLNALLSFRPLLSRYVTDLALDSESKPHDRFKLGTAELDRIGRLEAETPESRSVVVVGSFNLIEHSTRQFQLTLRDGRKVTGKADVSLIPEDTMRAAWGKQVTVKGTAHFNPVGKIRFIEASVIRSLEAGEEIFENLPERAPLLKSVEGLQRTTGAKSPFREVWGQWPGDESIDEILSLLRETSVETA